MKMKQPKGISINELAKLASKDQKHQNVWLGLGKIDIEISKFVKDIVADVVGEVKDYSYRTEFMNQCYSVIIYNAERQAYVGTSWPLADFLALCGSNKIEMELNLKIRRILLKFDETGISTGERVNWIY